jgi:Lysozyme like domain
MQLMPICGPNQSLTADQVAQFMRNAGFPESSIPTGIAISFNESSWQTGNCNPNDPNGGSFGLWQINGIHFAGSTTLACAFDPQCATNYAYFLSNGGQDWAGPWTNSWNAYENGQIHLPSGTSSQYTSSIAPGQKSGGCQCSPGDTVITIAGKQMCEHNGLTTFTYDCGANLGSFNPVDLTNAIYEWIKDPTRLIKLIFGVVLVSGALLILVNPTAGLAGELAKALKTAVPSPHSSFSKGAK